MNNIPFNKSALVGNEIAYLKQCARLGKISGDGIFTKKCQNFFKKRFKFANSFLTTSCTDAIEMAAILINCQANDEIIMPSYTFVSTANPFVLRGAKIKFVDSCFNHPNIDADLIEKSITKKTKAIVVVHYAGIACEMNKIKKIARKYNLYLIEDCAHAIDAYYKNRLLGSFGDFSAFSFHETKNLSCGEGGLLVVNNKKFVKRAEIIREKGTNRSAFFRGEINKYQWVDIGSSFLPSDLNAAFLYAQLEKIDLIQKKRKSIFNRYKKNLSRLPSLGIQLPLIPNYASQNGHLFYINCKNEKQKIALIKFLKSFGVNPASHYISLHQSNFYKKDNGKVSLINSDRFTKTLLRLPLYFNLSNKQIDYISKLIINFFKKKIK